MNLPKHHHRGLVEAPSEGRTTDKALISTLESPSWARVLLPLFLIVIALMPVLNTSGVIPVFLWMESTSCCRVIDEFIGILYSVPKTLIVARSSEELFECVEPEETTDWPWLWLWVSDLAVLVSYCSLLNSPALSQSGHLVGSAQVLQQI